MAQLIRKLLKSLTVTAFTALSCPAAAQSDASPTAVAQDGQKNAYLRTIELLDADGYRITAVDRTWLNRIMVRAVKGNIRREVVISEATGLVLRDVIYGE